MYRIRRESGDEITLASIDEFGAAVVAGIVTANAEIFHARAEKWLPIASHPHFKMAQDRSSGAASPKPPARSRGFTGSGQRPALTASGQRSAITVPPAPAALTAPVPQAPQLHVVRPDAPAATAPATTDATAAITQKPAQRWNGAQRPTARSVAPKPSTPPAPPAGDLRLVRADMLLSGAATAPALPDTEFELLPVLDERSVIEPVTSQPAVGEAAVVEHALEPVVETVIERTPAAVELVSQQERPAASAGEVEIINPDRTMPVVSGEMPALEIPAPIRDFTPAEAAVGRAARSSSKAPLFIGLGLVAAAAAIIAFFVFKPTSAAPAAPSVTSAPVASPAPTLTSTEPAAIQPAPAPSAPVVKTATPSGASSGLGGDLAPKKRRPPDDAQTASKTALGDGLEPPPEEVLPAAPSLGSVSDAVALPTVEAGAASPNLVDRTKALEKTRREIDSSMRR